MLGIAAIAAVAAMAFLGASSASATSTTLCTTNVLVCPAGNQLPNNTHVEGLAVNPELLSSLGTIKCNHSIILGKTTNGPLANPLVGSISLIDFTGNCNLGGTPCTVATTSLGTLLLLKTGVNHGTAQSHNNNVLVECGAFTHCVYGGLPTLLAHGFTDPSTLATIEANAVELSRISGFLCPSTSKWDAKYSIVLPHKFYIAQ